MKVVLSIAGSDSSGGAGIQADIKTMCAHGVFAETAITSVTAQNTTGVFGIVDMSADFVVEQIEAVFSDIRPDAVKIGMVPTAEVARAIATTLIKVKATNIVVDPVMVATTGADLVEHDARLAIAETLIPIADVLTPNIPEAEVIAGVKIDDKRDIEEAARIIMDKGCRTVVLKGGHMDLGADDLFITEHGREVWMRHRFIETPNTHGTGCTMSTAIACNLAHDFELQASVQRAKRYVAGALENDPGMGRGNGPLNHLWNLESNEGPWF